MEFIDASSAGTMKICIYIILDKLGQYFCRYSSFYGDSFVYLLRQKKRQLRRGAPKPRGDWSPPHNTSKTN